MGPEAYKPGVPTALKKCSERVTNSCDPIPTDGCCSVIPCVYCLEWHPYGHATQYGTAIFAGSSWSGTIAGATWIGYWQRNYYSGECEFVVKLDGHEIYRKACYAGQKCRDSSDSASATIGYDSGTIVWKKYESRPLEYVIDPDTKCRKYFCGNCDCSCTCLCVTITELNGYFFKGEICDVSYPCDGPLWVGKVGPYNLSIALGRDIYDRCIITATVDGHEQAPVLVSGCASMSATITLYDGTTIAIRCKKCDCEKVQPICCDRCLPLNCLTGAPTNCVNGLPLTLAVDITATPSFGSFTCFNGSGVLTFRSPVTGGTCCWDGTITGNCTDCNGASFTWTLVITVCCDKDGWNVSGLAGSPCGGPGSQLFQSSYCNPVLIEGCWTTPVSACFVGCLSGGINPIPSPEFKLCFRIYETP